jgi:hypothetical protein
VTSTCETCGREFEHRRQNTRPRRYCSRPCWAAAQRVTDRPPCRNCHEREARAKGLCLRCWKRQTSTHGLDGRPPRPSTCSLCGRGPVRARGWCSRHYESFLRWGDAEAIDRRDGEEYTDRHGYRCIRGKGLVHRLVMAAHLGRRLTKGEVVHHVNGDRTVNEMSNLHLYASQQEHKLAHASLEACAYRLVESGLIEFDRETGRYNLNRPMADRVVP